MKLIAKIITILFILSIAIGTIYFSFTVKNYFLGLVIGLLVFSIFIAIGVYAFKEF